MQSFWVYVLITIVLIGIGIGYSVYDSFQLKRKIKTLFNKQTTLFRQKGNHILFDHYYKHISKSEPRCIDDITWNDLSMDQLFQRINYHFTSVGEEYTYTLLRNFPGHNVDELIMNNVTEDVAYREKLSFILAKLGRNANNDASQFTVHYQKKERYNKLMILVSFLPILSLVMFYFGVSIGIFSVIVAMGVVMGLSVKFQSQSELVYNDLFYAIKIIDTANEIMKLNGHKSNISKMKSVKWMSYFMLNDDKNEGNIALTMINAIKQMFLIDYHLYHRALAILHKHQEVFATYFKVVGQADASYSTALWRTTLPYYAIPEVAEDKKLEAEEVYHPLLDRAVANDFNYAHSVLLTGSNASGKSTFMKTMAINLVMTQGLNTSTSERFVYQPGIVATSMNLEDSLAKGDSYFIAEIKSVKRLIEVLKLALPTYIFIDEILRGTNTKERIASATAILDYLNLHQNSLLFVATHDIELTEILTHFDFYYFKETLTEDNDITFDYTIRKGVTTTSNAIELMRIHNYPESIYDHAKAQLKQLEQLNVGT